MANPNLTSGQTLPGFWGYVDYNTQGGGSAPTKRALIWSYITSTGAYTPNVPRLPATQQEADDGCGRGSDGANDYAAAVSQPESQGADVWVMPIVAPSGGAAATYSFKVLIANTNPNKPGTVQIYINSVQLAAVGFDTSDTVTTIGDAIAAAINANLDLQCTATDAAGAITVTYRHKGTTGEDLPVRVNVSPTGTGVVLAAGVATLSGTAGADGSIAFTFGATTVTTAISNGTTAPNIASAIVASFNASTYGLYAQIDPSSTSKVDLLFQNDTDVRRISGQINTTTTTTVDLGSGAVSQGGGSTTNGTVGVGAPSLTTALSNLTALGVFRSWSSPWLDSTTVSAEATNIEASSDGSISGQKQQILTLGDYRAASVAGALAPACSPNLTTTAPHYAVLWSPDAPVKGSALAARAAAARASFWLDTPQKNWNGFQLKGNQRAPILGPTAIAKPSLLMQNSALRTYGLAPAVLGDSGNIEVVKGRTTSLAADKRLWAWSTEAQAAYHAVDLALFFKARFTDTSLVRYSDPKAPGIVDALSFQSATQERMAFWEQNGNYDGADLFATAVKATIDGNNPFRVNVEYPESPVLDLDQVVFSGHFSQPSA